MAKGRREKLFVEKHQDPGAQQVVPNKDAMMDELLIKLTFLNPGWTVAQVTEEFNLMTGLSISENAIKARLSKYRERYEEIAPERIEQLRMREAQRLDQLEQEAWRAWNNHMAGTVDTLEVYRKNKSAESDIKDFELIEIKKKTIENKIDIAILNTIFRIQAERQKLLGLQSAQAQATAVDAINKNDAMKVYVGVSPDEWGEKKEDKVIEAEISK